jgi:peroxiredoxin Q/BCP
VNPANASRHEKFRQKYQLPFPILVDAGQKAARLYRASAGFVPKRTVYMIGPDGSIRYARRGKPDPAEVLAAI